MADGSLEIHNTSGGVFSFQDFHDWFDECPEQRTVAWGKIGSLKDRLEQSSEEIKDPIAFLHDLYFGKEYSLRRILDHSVVNNFYSLKGIRNLFVESFQWEVRTKTQRTPQHEKIAHAKVQQGIKKFEDQIADLLGSREKTRVFSMNEFNGKRYRMGRALYILKTLGGIDKNMLLFVASSEGLGPRILANALNKQLQNILSKFADIDIEYETVKLTPQSIDKWIAYKENQQ